jgi:hypothetical protein
LQVTEEPKPCNPNEGDQRNDRNNQQRGIKLAEIAKHMCVFKFKAAANSDKSSNIRRCLNRLPAFVL